MRLTELREARISRRTILWGDVRGVVLRVAKDGTWADMEWWTPDSMRAWVKRQPLDRLADWRLRP